MEILFGVYQRRIRRVRYFFLDCAHKINRPHKKQDYRTKQRLLGQRQQITLCFQFRDSTKYQKDTQYENSHHAPHVLNTLDCWMLRTGLHIQI